MKKLNVKLGTLLALLQTLWARLGQLVLSLLGRKSPSQSSDAPPPAGAEPAAQVAKPQMRRDDQEFLPAALEILERPPSPVGWGMMYFIVAIAVVALLWSWFSWTDIVAVGSGKIQPAGRVKTVQVVETGRVKQIFVSNGQRVKAGDAVVEVEPDDALADRGALANMVFVSRAEILRRNRSIEVVNRGGAAALTVAWPADLPADVTHVQERLMADELRAVLAQLGAIEAQKQQKLAEIAKVQSVMASQKQLLGIMQERVQMRADLLAQNDVSRAQLIDAQEALAQQTTTYMGQLGSVAELERGVEVLESEAVKIRQGFVADQMGKLAEAEKALNESSARLLKANLRVERTVLRSPVDGVIHASTLTSLGQVLTPGQEVMRIVPDADQLEIEVYLPNKDIGFVRVGQAAAIKVESFPFTRYGTLSSKVTHVARDAIPEADAKQVEADPSRPHQRPEIAGAQRVQSLVFPVTLVASLGEMNVDGQPVPLAPGMAVTAEIKIGKRRILEYLFAPLLEVTNRAMRER